MRLNAGKRFAADFLSTNLLVFIQLFAIHRLLNFRIKNCLDQRKQAAVRKSRIVDCGKDKLITEIPEQEQNYQYDAYPVKNACPFASLPGREEPAV
jgi:hypothetical protein